jgi:hypothetical protein
MAAAFRLPVPSGSSTSGPVVARPALGVVATARRPLARKRRPLARRLAAAMLPIGLLVGIWCGVAALAARADAANPVHLAGSVRSGDGFRYVVRPGDTLWSIALRLEPNGDPAAVVALLERETIDGAEVGRLVDEGFGRPVHDHPDLVPSFAPTESVDGHDPEATPAGGPGFTNFSVPTDAWQASGRDPLGQDPLGRDRA